MWLDITKQVTQLVTKFKKYVRTELLQNVRNDLGLKQN